MTDEPIAPPPGLREALIRRIELARAFIAKEHADPTQEVHGDWISREAKPAHDALCLCLQALAAQSPVLPPSGAERLRGSMNAQWMYDPEGEAYYFAPMQAAPGPYLTQRHVDAILDIASDGTLAGVELIDNVPPPPIAALSASVAGEPTYTEDQVRAAVEVTIQKMLDSGELIDNRALASPAQQKSLQERACK